MMAEHPLSGTSHGDGSPSTETRAGRETILQAIHMIGQAPLPRPPRWRSSPDTQLTSEERLARFIDAATCAGALVSRARQDADAAMSAGTLVLPAHERAVAATTAGALVVEAELGVAENGAVWLTDAVASDRRALMLADHVLVTLPIDRIVDDMHAACARIHLAAHRFGVFMAGPSKTADIEQALVVGAQGPRSVTILLIDSRP